MNRLVIILLVVLVVAVNWLYDGKMAEVIGNALHTWQTGETRQDRLEREERRAFLEEKYAGAEACHALRDFAPAVGAQAVGRRGLWAEVLLENVKGNPNRELVSDYLAIFEKYAYKDTREFDGEVRRIVRRYCS